MSLRKIAGLLAASGLMVGVLGTGVGAQFTDGVTAQQNISVGTFGCVITDATDPAGIAAGGKSVTYTAPAIMSSAASSAPFSFTVKNTGSGNAYFKVTSSGVLGTHPEPFSVVAITPANPAGPVGAGLTAAFNTGIAWSELGNPQLGQAYTVNFSVACNDNGVFAN